MTFYLISSLYLASSVRTWGRADSNN